jgi:hypothetical protein
LACSYPVPGHITLYLATLPCTWPHYPVPGHITLYLATLPCTWPHYPVSGHITLYLATLPCTWPHYTELKVLFPEMIYCVKNSSSDIKYKPSSLNIWFETFPSYLMFNKTEWEIESVLNESRIATALWHPPLHLVTQLPGWGVLCGNTLYILRAVLYL